VIEFRFETAYRRGDASKVASLTRNGVNYNPLLLHNTAVAHASCRTQRFGTLRRDLTWAGIHARKPILQAGPLHEDSSFRCRREEIELRRQHEVGDRHLIAGKKGLRGEQTVKPSGLK
jgi:hypothetical protein